MSNHIHLLLEIVPLPAAGITDGELRRRLRAIQSEAQVAQSFICPFLITTTPAAHTRARTNGNHW
jgi:hypothetical protein